MTSTGAHGGSCPRCGGRGWVIEADAGVGSARRCSCYRDELGPRLLEAAGIPPRHRRCRLENFDIAHSPRLKAQLMQARDLSRRYVDGFLVDEEGGQLRGSGLIYIGPPGVGKTHLAAAVLTELIERYRVRGRFVEFTALVHQIQSTFDPTSSESKHRVLEPVMYADVLVLDELGSQNPTPWVRDVLYLLVNTRYTRRLPTLFTTNYRLEEKKASPGRARPENLDRGADDEPAPAWDRHGLLTHRLSAMLTSRLCEMAKPVFLDAIEDYREEVLMHRIRV